MNIKNIYMYYLQMASDEHWVPNDVWEETLKRYKDVPKKRSVVYNDFVDEEYLAHSKRYDDTEVVFQNDDCIKMGVDLVRAGYTPLMLNMASQYNPGGGVRKGSIAQEEELFRCSDYDRHLDRRPYPLPPYRMIVSHDVEFYRLSRFCDYMYLKAPVKIDCIAGAALIQPFIKNRHLERKEDEEVMLRKIRMLFHVAYVNGNDSLVLSAWGCGAFRCPPLHIAKLFRTVVEENRGRFKKIVFAITERNYELFTSGYTLTEKKNETLPFQLAYSE